MWDLKASLLVLGDMFAADWTRPTGTRKKKSNKAPLTHKELMEALKKDPVPKDNQASVLVTEPEKNPPPTGNVMSKKARKMEKKRARKQAMQPIAH